MQRNDENWIVDQSALRMRVATVAAGVWLTYAVCGASALYLAATWHGPHRPLIAGLFGCGALGAALIWQLPRETIVRSRYREIFFFAWSLIDLFLITGGSVLDGGAASPLTLIFFIPVVFAAMSYPLRSVLAVGGFSIAMYLATALTSAALPARDDLFFAAMLACTCAMSAWQARNHERQREELLQVSRADPLTGCLNRRGFEERAVAEIAAAARSAREGAVLVLDVDHFKLVNDRQGHAAGDDLLRWVVQTIQRTVRPADAVGRLGGDEFGVLFADTAPADALEIAARISEALARRAPASIGVASFPGDGVELEQLIRHADMRLYDSRGGRERPLTPAASERLSWAATLAHAVDMRMNVHHEHSQAVADYAVAIGRMLGWAEERIGMLRIAAMLHDVGKVSVPDRVLCKPATLTLGEFEWIKSHSAAGAELVARVEGLDPIVPWIRHSHESFDGSGYPDGLRGESIPQASRIMLVADAFDAITSTRPYRDALSITFACEELARHAGSQFDPECVEALLSCLRDGKLRVGDGANVPPAGALRLVS
jgi:diguanylate cyclase (GGDEF)-like protein